jgi:Ca-activated chloride channel family protein
VFTRKLLGLALLAATAWRQQTNRLVREADTQLYSVGIFEPSEYRSRTPEELNGPTFLNEMAEFTGGLSFSVGKPNELPDIAAKIGAELRNQYVVGYHPSHRAHAGGRSRSSCAHPGDFLL